MIKVFTDTSANLPLKLIEKNNLSVLPFSYTVNGREDICYAQTEFDGKGFYDAMRLGVQIKTSMINTQTFYEAFEKAILDGADVLYIGMSGGISGTAGAAQTAAEKLSKQYPNAKIAAIDTFAASLGEGFLVLDAAKMIQDGKGFDEVKNRILEKRNNMCQFFTVDDLEYLKKGGRISGAVAFVGNLLNIKPILKGNEIGEIVLCGKTRGIKRAYADLAERYDRLVSDKNAQIGIAHADNKEGVRCLLEKLKKVGYCGECLTVCYETVTGAHVGPGAVALFFYGSEK